MQDHLIWHSNTLHIDKELLENPILDSEYPKESDTEIDIDSLRDQLIQADENVEAYKQWEPHSTSDEYSYENFVAFNYTLTEFLIESIMRSLSISVSLRLVFRKML